VLSFTVKEHLLDTVLGLNVILDIQKAS